MLRCFQFGVICARFGLVAGLAVVSAGAMAATAVPAPVFSVTGKGFTSLDQGVTRTPFATNTSTLPNGGTSLSIGGQQEIRDPASSAIVVVSAAGNGAATARPGAVGARLFGKASFADDEGGLGGLVEADIGASTTQYIPIGGAGLADGTLVDFTASYHIDGFSSSERPPPFNGPYSQTPGHTTGTFFFTFTAYTVNGTSLAYNDDAVGSGTRAFPNGFFTSVPTTLDFGQIFEMSGRVGDFLVLETQLRLTVNDRAFAGVNLQESTLDFSNTVNLFADAVTPGLRFVANGHDYSSVAPVPVPAAGWLLASALAGLACRRRPLRT